MAQTVSKGALERRTAQARLEVEQLKQQLRGLADVAATEELLVRMQETISALDRSLDVPIGLSVTQAAAVLQVSKPTVSKWMNEQLLEQLPDRRPVEVTQVSVLRVNSVLEGVRREFPAKQWTAQLAAFLHDRDLQDQDWFVEGVAQAERGEFVER